MYRINYTAPLAEEYTALRVKVGMTAKDIVTARSALESSIFSVCIRMNADNKLIGMGRLIGDFTSLQIVDVMIDPEYQGNKLGRRIMEELMKYIKEKVPRSCFVNLFSDVDYLY